MYKDNKDINATLRIENGVIKVEKMTGKVTADITNELDQLLIIKDIAPQSLEEFERDPKRRE